MNDCDIAENCTGNSSQVICVSSIHETKNPTCSLEITMNVTVLYSKVYKNCVKSIDAEKNQHDTEIIFHMTFVVYFAFMLV